VRPAQPGDLAAIHGLIGELADYEKLRHQFVGSQADLGLHPFGPRPCAWALVAEVDGVVRAFALSFRSYSTFLCRPGIYLEDLYVQPAHRRQGLGRALLKALAQQAVEEGCGRLEWAVLDWNAPSIRFLPAAGCAADG
jgi:GNAT superfamily N-acetyltransferase